mmetsp:Transcript_30540/g.93413  ORF Transcript_30540/g.93413 Transcript_30540/m.93413 type:complete len:106 (+) Transcript_30540:2648-2965(+)
MMRGHGTTLFLMTWHFSGTCSRFKFVDAFQESYSIFVRHGVYSPLLAISPAIMAFISLDYIFTPSALASMLSFSLAGSLAPQLNVIRPSYILETLDWLSIPIALT